MDQFWRVFSNADQLLIFGSVILILLGIVAPKRFIGIEVDWTPAKSALILIIGLGLLGFSVCRVFWWSPQKDNGADDGWGAVRQGYDPTQPGYYGGADIYPNKTPPRK